LDYASIWFKGFDDPGAAGKRFENAIKIDAGLLMILPWEDGHTILGNGISHYRNLTGQVTNVEIGFNYVLVNDKNSARQGITLGSYINGYGIRDDYKHDPLFVHEFGHTIQSKLLGPLYMSKAAIPSGISGYLDYYTTSSHNHNKTWFEINANQFGQMFFNPIYDLAQGDNPKEYSTSFKNIDWKWFLLFNPIIF
jgi:hypothetical protein